eukprot:TRINITY_DN777853_c0_g1_i1.p1 TRINITY_DN777853_c0_g1~~TRINITY_DN777853_c0_g1_i1.p1  ORF type:complete len:361 (-),score=97.98 TRINITY_DN777853_c0_g1_i1:352-1434(-)
MMSSTMSVIDKHVISKKFEALSFEQTCLEYVWIGGTGQDIRCKTKVVKKTITSIEDCPLWNYDGSSTGQANGEDSEVILRPVAIYPDPFRPKGNLLVLCDCLTPSMEPIPTNYRDECAKVMEAAKDEHPWFGMEQEYTLFTMDKSRPLGWPAGGYPGKQGPYYCSAGADVAYGREIVEAHMRCCLYAGLNISGTNAEVMPGQWEYQVGPCEGTSAGDEMWIARYIMNRVCEEFSVICSFDPKPVAGDWNGAGCHCNVSTEVMREAGGYKAILQAVAKLSERHFEHIAVYGKGNDRRLTGQHETASIQDFSWGVGNRGASIRIPTATEKNKCGYFEDRRPASNCEPYSVISRMISTICLDE